MNRAKADTLKRVASKHSISMKLLKMVFGTYCLATIFLTSIQMWHEFSREKQEIAEELVLYQPLFAKNLANFVWYMDLAQLEVTLDSILLLPEVVGVSIHDRDNSYIVRKGIIGVHEHDMSPIAIINPAKEQPQFAKDLFSHRFNLFSPSEQGQTEHIGQAIFYSNSAIAFSRVRDLFWSIVLFATIKTLFLWGVFLYFGHVLLGRPLLKLVSETARVSMDQTGRSIDVEHANSDEIQLLNTAFSKMELLLKESMASLTDGYARLNAMATVLELSSGSKPIRTLFKQVLEELVSQNWISVYNGKILGAAILLYDKQEKNLVMQAHVNMPEDVLEQCKNVTLGECLCGQAFTSGKILTAYNLHKTSENRQPQTDARESKCYYSIPIFSSGRNLTIGVITFFVLADYNHDPDDTDFLASIANVLTNLIERKMAEDALNQHQDYLEKIVDERTKQLAHSERLASLGTFAAGMAHEINNPNSFISGNIDFLKQFWAISRPILKANQAQDASGRVGDFLDEVEETLDGMLDGSRRISKIIDSLKTYSKGGMESDKVECRLLEPIQDSQYLLQHRLKQGFTLSVEVPDDIVVICDRQQLSQVFVNLLNNSMDALEGLKNGQSKLLAIKAEIVDEHIWIIVRDNGPGIPKEAVGMIFDPFYTSKGKTKGTGLGLSIVHGIITDHAGQITVYSSPNVTEDTEFLIMLPTRDAYKTIVNRRSKNRKIGV